LLQKLGEVATRARQASSGRAYLNGLTSFDVDTTQKITHALPIHKENTQVQPPQQQKRYAVLVDSENAQLNSMELIMREIENSFGGNASVRRVYGDFSYQHAHAMHLWRDFCLEQAFLPVHAFSYVQGKGSSDAALMIDTIELLFTNPSLDGFCIVSSDSDFTRLAQRLRESGKHVVGFGHQHTPEPFVSACEAFVFVNVLMQQEEDRLLQEEQVEAAKQMRLDEKTIEALKKEKEEATAALEQEEGEKKTEQSFVGRWSSYFATLFGDSKIEDGSVSGQISRQISRKIPVPRETLDHIHAICEKHSDALGCCRLSVLAQEGHIDGGSFGYEKISQLIADYPEEFELNSDLPSYSVKSLKPAQLPLGTIRVLPKGQLRYLHKLIKKYSDENGWANMSLVASESKVDVSEFGCTKFSQFIKNCSSEFRSKTEGTTALIKSVRG